MGKFQVSSRKSEILHFEGLLLSKSYKVYKYIQSTEDLSLMTLKSDAKFKEKLTWGFKYDMGNLGNFHPTTPKSETFTLMGSFCSKYIRFELEKYRGVIFHDTEPWCKIWINPDLVVSKMTWKIGWTFIRALQSLKNCTLMGSFCPKYLTFQPENFRGIMCHYVSWHWRMMQNLKKTWLVAWKMT